MGSPLRLSSETSGCFDGRRDEDCSEYPVGLSHPGLSAVMGTAVLQGRRLRKVMGGALEWGADLPARKSGGPRNPRRSYE